MEIVKLNINGKTYRAEITSADGWYVGWVQGVKGINCQAFERDELIATIAIELKDTLDSPIKGSFSLVPEYDYIPMILVERICADLGISMEEFENA